MLRPCPPSTSSVLSTRLTLAPTAGKLHPSLVLEPRTSPIHTSQMSTAAVARPQPPGLASQRPKQQPQADEKSAKIGRGMPSFFSVGYRDAVYQWWNMGTAQTVERNVISFVPFIKDATADGTSQTDDKAQPDPYGNRIWKSTMVPLSGKNRAMNEFSVERVGENVDNTLVMLHGYGAGLGLFYQNFEPLTRAQGWKLYALDMLGMGNSSRPPFKIHAKDPQGKIAEAESWFVDSLEEWRKIRKIDKFTLLGHSLGGYLAVSYALKYPGRLNKLILASPVGIPEDPYAVNADMPEPKESTFTNEFTQAQDSIVSQDATSDNDSFNKKDSRTAAETTYKAKPTNTPPKRPTPGWLMWLWDANVSPFSIVRLTGPLGPRFVSGWTSRRFNHLPAEEAQALHSYAYSLFRQRGSGEYALPYLLAPGAYARSPVIRRIQDVGRQVIRPATSSSSSGAESGAAPEVRETGIPVVLMYGESDWMDVAGGYAAEEKLKQRSRQALLNGTDEEKRAENGKARVLIVRKAGHHLYLDNPDEFNKYIVKEMKETRDWTLGQKALKQ